jgi:hypothetical protein
MQIDIYRQPSSDRSTIGELYVNKRFQCYTLEDVVRPNKIQGMTAIPSGSYDVLITFSQRFQRDLPLIADVPRFSGIRIHPGNTDADTEGCILVGTQAGIDVVTNSRAAFDKLFAMMEESDSNGEKITLQIRDGTGMAA